MPRKLLKTVEENQIHKIENFDNVFLAVEGLIGTKNSI
jgi:hypothetical protein